MFKSYDWCPLKRDVSEMTQIAIILLMMVGYCASCKNYDEGATWSLSIAELACRPGEVVFKDEVDTIDFCAILRNESDSVQYLYERSNSLGLNTFQLEIKNDTTCKKTLFVGVFEGFYRNVPTAFEVCAGDTVCVPFCLSPDYWTGKHWPKEGDQLNVRVLGGSLSSKWLRIQYRRRDLVIPSGAEGQNPRFTAGSVVEDVENVDVFSDRVGSKHSSQDEYCR